MKNQKTSIRCKHYIDNVLQRKTEESRVIYQDKDGAFVRVMGNRLPVMTDSEGMYYDYKIKSVKTISGIRPFTDSLQLDNPSSVREEIRERFPSLRRIV